jgi:hypothetical protein
MENYQQLKWRIDTKPNEIKDGVVFLMALNSLPQTQVKALCSKWFLPIEIDSIATPSLWSSNQDQVLEELLEILKQL